MFICFLWKAMRSPLSLDWATTEKQNQWLILCLRKNMCFTRLLKCILVLSRWTSFLQALSLLLLSARERLVQETWNMMNAVWTKDIALTAVSLPFVTLTVACFVFDRWREVGKALTWKQHGKLFYPFALGDVASVRALEKRCERTGIAGARAPHCVIWLQLLWVQTLILALLEGRE